MRQGRRLATIAVIGVAATLVLSACTKKNEETAASTAAGTTAASAAASSGGAAGATVKVAFVPKLQGVPYFEAMNTGGQAAAKELGNVEWLYQGPTQADAAAQADIVRSFIQQKVDTLIVAPNDSEFDGALATAGQGRRHPRGDRGHGCARFGA